MAKITTLTTKAISCRPNQNVAHLAIVTGEVEKNLSQRGIYISLVYFAAK